MDRQSEAYRLATEADWAGANLAECDVYPDGDERPIRTPDYHEARYWDRARGEPKTLAEARAALAARIADPTAPDDASVAHAYDELGA